MHALQTQARLTVFFGKLKHELAHIVLLLRKKILILHNRN